MARVLVVDDDEVSRLVIGKILEAAKHEVAYAVNGEQGIAYYKKNPSDVIVTDLVMPVMNGLQMIRELYERYRDVKIIAVTGVDPENLPLAQELGAVATMTKPVNPQELLELIEKAMQTSRGWEDVME
ncbi:MAG: response regulator [Gemmatimonadota bacterium]|nr:MAG: response regulator [Gemmatimonadota bacterium]